MVSASDPVTPSVVKWENYISINPPGGGARPVLGPVKDYVDQSDGSVVWNTSRLSIATAIGRDVSPLPTTEDREGYYGSNHYNFWASGLRDLLQITQWCEANQLKIGSFLDLGCASGRVLRHVHHQTDVKRVIGCDINSAHVDWIARNLPPQIVVFQNTSMPSLPLPDASVDFVSAFSVMTHLDALETTWLMEIRRILQPGGVAWLTFHSEQTWKDMGPGWPLYEALTSHPDHAKTVISRSTRALPSDRMVFRWDNAASYNNNVFHSSEYIRTRWGRILDFVDIVPCQPHFQDTAILRKPDL